MKNASTIVAVIALVAGLAVWQWRHTAGQPAPVAAPKSLQALARAAGVGLPQAYADGFSVVHVGVEGQRLVFDIRSSDIAVAQIDPAKLPMMRDQEQQDLVAAACGDPDVVPALQNGAAIVRRFSDKDGRPIFEVSAVRRHCGKMM
jgi:hypothetical protein